MASEAGPNVEPRSLVERAREAAADKRANEEAILRALLGGSLGSGWMAALGDPTGVRYVASGRTGRLRFSAADLEWTYWASAYSPSAYSPSSPDLRLILPCVSCGKEASVPVKGLPDIGAALEGSHLCEECNRGGARGPAGGPDPRDCTRGRPRGNRGRGEGLTVPVGYVERAAGVREIPLTQGKVALVDEEDYELVAGFSWSASKRARTMYANAYVRGTGRAGRAMVYMHRIIMSPPAGVEVDHIDGDGLNNTRANLRLCTRAQNHQNHHGTRSRITTYRGITFDGNTGTWVAQIQMDGRGYRLGTFDNAYDAACEYDIAASCMFGQFASLNFPWLWGDEACL